jgi:hypothetical protein
MKLLMVALAMSASVLYALPIDCNDNQVCTGTVCVHQQVTSYCDNIQYSCDNDSQYYAGGNQICCTNKNVCYSCLRVVNGHFQTFNVYNYSGVGGACYPN